MTYQTLYTNLDNSDNFDKSSTYFKLRYSFEDLDVLKHQPVTVFAFGNYSRKGDGEDNLPDGKIAPRLFMEVATQVLKSGLDGKLKRSTVESLILQCRPQAGIKERRVMKELNQVVELFDNKDDLRILYNQELNSILTRLAELLAPYLSKANTEISKEVRSKYESLFAEKAISFSNKKKTLRMYLKICWFLTRNSSVTLVRSNSILVF